MKRTLAAICGISCILALSACTITINTGTVDPSGNVGSSGNVDLSANEISINESNYVTKTYDITDSFDSISIDVDIDDVTFIPAEDGKCSIVCVEDEADSHTVKASGNTLKITKGSSDQGASVEGSNPSLTLYLPEKTYQDITVNTSIGNVTIGKTDCKNFSSTVLNGDVNLTDLVASGTMKLEVTLGSISFTDCDAATISAETTNGNIIGTLLTDKVFSCSAITGSVAVPASSGSGTCDLTTISGDIRIQVKE